MQLSVTVNDQSVRVSLASVEKALRNPQPLLKIGGQVMRSSIVQTFRGQGSPDGSWAPLAASTRLRGKGGAGRKILIQSGRLESSITDDSQYQISGNTLTIGTNLVYARIQQEGGFAGRSTPANRTLKHEIRKEARGVQGPRNRFGYFSFRRPYIPARPYLVVRPEDPQKIAAAMERYLATQVPGANGGA